MLRRRSIRIMLIVNFSILLLIFVGSMLFTFFTLNKTVNINTDITDVYNPSVKKLESLKLNIISSRILINNWVNKQSDNNDPDKIALKHLLDSTFKNNKLQLVEISENWSKEQQVKLKESFQSVDSLVVDYNVIMSTLSSFDAYSDPMALFMVSPMILAGGEASNHYNSAVRQLDVIIDKQNKLSGEVNKDMSTTLAYFKNILVLLIVVSIALGIFIMLRTIKAITIPIIQVRDALVKMGLGILYDKKLSVSNNEIGEMSEALNVLNDGLRRTVDYSEKIGNGDLESSFDPLSENDVLGNSLLEMGEKLKQLSEDDKKRNWATLGLAKFAQIMREHQRLEDLSNVIIADLTKYIGANQSALFLISKGEDNTDFLEMKACYAYNRKKFLQKRIDLGEGLVGQCLIEKQTVYITDVPESYVKITSGLGDSAPRCIVLIPLITNETIQGVLEIASFEVLGEYIVAFLEKVCESLAGTISTIRINEQTLQLLEESKINQSSMHQKEEEMRQNLEELNATQEEMTRKEVIYKQKIEELEQKLKKSNS